MTNILLKILDFFKFGSSSQPLSNKTLSEMMEKHFSRQLEEHSLKKRMLYPMTFYIFVHPEDWAALKQDLQFIIPEIIDGFYAIINSNRKKHPNYTPPAEHWFLQFSEVSDGSMVMTSDGQKVQLAERGSIYILSSILGPKTYDDGTTTENNVKFSFTSKNSNTDSTVNINPAAIAKVDKLGEGVFTLKFDLSLCGNVPEKERPISSDFGGGTQTATSPAPGASPSQVYPELTWQNGSVITHFTIRTNYLIITDEHDPVSGPNVRKIAGDGISRHHLAIKYDSASNAYYLCPFAPTILNQKHLKVCTEDAPRFEKLANRSRIILNDKFEINFSFPRTK